MKKHIVLAFVLAGCSILAARTISPRRVISNVEERLASEETVKVDFRETYTWTLTGEEQSLSGELLLSGKDRFRVTTEDQVIVSDGHVLWTYNQPSHRVLIDDLSDSENAILPRQILFQTTRDYEARIAGEVECDDRSCYELVFTSETGDVFFPMIRVWVDSKEWVPVKVEQTDLNENRTVYELLDVQVGFPAAEEAFRFSVPDGAEVVDMR